MSWLARYGWNVLVLWGTRKINWRTALHGIRHQPSALAGRGGSYSVDPDLERQW